MLKKVAILIVILISCFSFFRADEPVINVYVNGAKKFEIEMKDGKRNGKATFWRENGSKISEIEYKDDMQNGKRNEWSEKGVKDIEWLIRQF